MQASYTLQQHVPYKNFPNCLLDHIIWAISYMHRLGRKRTILTKADDRLTQNGRSCGQMLSAIQKLDDPGQRPILFQ